MVNMKIIGSGLYQWEVGRQLQIIPLRNMAVDSVHFSNPGDIEALVVKPKEVNGMIVADIPNILLQSGSNLVVYSVNVSSDKVETLVDCTFSVRSRAKPSDYVYTETEILNYSYLDKRIDGLEGEGLSKAVADYLEKNPVQAGATEEEKEQIQQNKDEIERLDADKLSESDLNDAIDSALATAKASGEFDGKDGQDGKAGQDGYTPKKNVDYFDGEDGISPVVSVSEITGGHRITITDANGTKIVDVLDGEPGKDGEDGKDGSNGNGIKSAILNADYTLTLTFDDGTSYTTPSIRGATGATGKTAYQCAKDGGYTGTEAEFSAKLAKEYPTKVSELTNDSKFITASGAPVQSVNGKTGAVVLDADSVGARPSTWTPTYSDVGAEKSGTAGTAVSTHNTKTDSHNDIRLLITALTNRLDALANSDDETLDQMAEVVAYIKSNRDLIDQITTGKVSVTDIVNNLTTNVANKPLSAAQGVALKALIDAITVPTKLSQLAEDSTHRLVTDAEKTSWNAKSTFSGNYNDLTGKPTIPTVPTKVSAFTNDAGYLTSYTETDPTVPSWAKETSKPSYTKSEVGLSNVDNVKQYSASNPPPYPVTSVNGKTGALTLDATDVGARPSAWTPSASDVGAVPTSRKVNGKALSANITLTASDVGAVPNTQTITVTGIDADGNSHSWTMYGVSV